MDEKNVLLTIRAKAFSEKYGVYPGNESEMSVLDLAILEIFRAHYNGSLTICFNDLGPKKEIKFISENIDLSNLKKKYGNK